MTQERLTGGNMNEVTREGDSVFRTAGPWTPTVHRLLRHLHEQGLAWVPEPRGMSPDGCEIVGFIEGIVPSYPMPSWVWAESVLVDTARKLRALHDATVGYVDPNASWQLTTHQPEEVICHNDFAPYNMVFEDGECIGAIDFDMVSPGPRLWDLAYLAYRVVPLTDPANPDVPGFDEETVRARLARLIDAYGVPCSAIEVLEMTIARLEDLARFSDHMAEERRNPELRDHAELYRRDAVWVRKMIRHESTIHRESGEGICDS
ncbi:MAG TPA: phosphotransferase [Thermomicrobiales bacterium]|nr:phosphotransferase [Thermomicrobiales bacterium]